MEDQARPIQCVAVIGAGEQGRNFALRCAQAGFDTVLEDVMPARLRDAQAAAEEEPGLLSHLRFALTVEDAVRGADLVMDFMPDELESKLEIFSMVDRMAPPRTILCTPTMAMSIGDLAACTYRAERCVALATGHAGLMADRPIRLITTTGTRPDVTDSVSGWLGRLGYEVVAEVEEPVVR